MVKNIVLCLTEVILNKTRVEMYEFSFDKLHGLSGNRLSDCPKVSEKVFGSRAEPNFTVSIQRIYTLKSWM